MDKALSTVKQNDEIPAEMLESSSHVHVSYESVFSLSYKIHSTRNFSKGKTNTCESWEMAPFLCPQKSDKHSEKATGIDLPKPCPKPHGL